jgi:site-specific DNA recombinase
VVTAAGIYARISLDRTGQELGVTRQLDDATALAARLGWPVGGRYVDNDVSAFRARRRPEYQRLLEDLKAGRIDAVVVYHPDRLTRRPVELEELIEILEATGAPVATVAAGDYDLGTASGRMIARILGSIARGESERMGERVARKKLELAEAGRPPGGGMRAYGYEPDGMTVRPGEADALRMAAARVLAGESYAQVAARLNADGQLRDGGAAWTGHKLRRTLTGARWAGLREYHGTAMGPAAWPAIIDPGTRESLLSLHLVRRRAPTRRVPYLVSGIAWCACSARLYRRVRYGVVEYYCSPHRGCGGLSIRAERLDPHVDEHVTGLLADPRTLAGWLARQGGGEALAVVEEAIAGVQADLERLAAMHGAGDLEAGEWAALRAPLRQRLAELRARRLELPAGRDVVDVEAVAAAWRWMDVGARNAFLRSIGMRIDLKAVGRGRGPVPPGERVTISP